MAFRSKNRALFLFAGLMLFWVSCAQAGSYASSAHGNSATGVDRSSVDTKFSSYATGNCGHCHEQHASIEGAEPVPVEGGASDYLLFMTGPASKNDFCFYCHGTSPKGGADDIQSSFLGTYTHDPNSLKGAVTCVDCHNPHVAQDTTHSPAVDGNTASGALLGVSGVEPLFVNPGTPSPGNELLSTPNYTEVDSITKEYQLCLKCHSSYNGGPPTGLSDQGQQFNPSNYSHHPVTGTAIWRNDVIRANPTRLLKAPWGTNLNARMHCSDCHGSDDSLAPKGPHGSNKKYLLKAWGGVNSDGTFPNAANAPDMLCILCHASEYGNGQGVSNTGVNVPWDHKSNPAHRYEGETSTSNSLGCAACHGGPAGYANFSSNEIQPSTIATSNGGRTGAIHGENFYWQNPDGYANNPADHFLVGGYNVGMYLSSSSGRCWSYGNDSGGDPCGSMKGGKAWP